MSFLPPGSAPAVAVARGRSTWSLVNHEAALLAAATAATWVHTIDELRIGVFIAAPFGLINVALAGAWPRLRAPWRAGSSIAFGLFWALSAIPYHLVPLLGGSVTGQNVSGLSRVIGGAAMVWLGVTIGRRAKSR